MWSATTASFPLRILELYRIFELIDLETVRRVRGKAAKGQRNNPPPKAPGRQRQRRSDRTVDQELDRFVDQVENDVDPWQSSKANNTSDDGSSSSSSSAASDGELAAVDIDDPLRRTGSQRRWISH